MAAPSIHILVLGDTHAAHSGATDRVRAALEAGIEGCSILTAAARDALVAIQRGLSACCLVLEGGELGDAVLLAASLGAKRFVVVSESADALGRLAEDFASAGLVADADAWRAKVADAERAETLHVSEGELSVRMVRRDGALAATSAAVRGDAAAGQPGSERAGVLLVSSTNILPRIGPVVSGRVAGGELRVRAGTRLVALPSGETVTARSMQLANAAQGQEAEAARHGEDVGVLVEGEALPEDLRRAQVLVAEAATLDRRVGVATRVQALLVRTRAEPYLLHDSGRVRLAVGLLGWVDCTVESARAVACAGLEPSDVAHLAELRCERPAALSSFAALPELGKAGVRSLDEESCPAVAVAFVVRLLSTAQH